MRKTKIVCTIGPACDSEEMLRAMMLAGMNVARLNFSHGTHAEHQVRIDRIKKLRTELGLPIAIMLDTKGPEYRIGTFEDGKITLNTGDTFTFTTEPVTGSSERVSVSYPGLARDLEAGDTVLVNDGLIALTVTATTDTDVICRVTAGGVLSDRKSMSFPNKVLKQTFLSEQDKDDLLFGIENDVDFVAASFVSRKQDLADLNAFLRANGGEDISVIAKIENQPGIDNIAQDQASGVEGRAGSHHLVVVADDGVCRQVIHPKAVGAVALVRALDNAVIAGGRKCRGDLQGGIQDRRHRGPVCSDLCHQANNLALLRRDAHILGNAGIFPLADGERALPARGIPRDDVGLVEAIVLVLLLQAEQLLQALVFALQGVGRADLVLHGADLTAQIVVLGREGFIVEQIVIVPLRLPRQRGKPAAKRREHCLHGARAPRRARERGGQGRGGSQKDGQQQDEPDAAAKKLFQG